MTLGLRRRTTRWRIIAAIVATAYAVAQSPVVAAPRRFRRSLTRFLW